MLVTKIFNYFYLYLLMLNKDGYYSQLELFSSNYNVQIFFYILVMNGHVYVYFFKT